MDTKGSKGIIGITLAIIMIASIFAAMAPLTTADVRATAEFGGGKVTTNGNYFYLGDVINYSMWVQNQNATYEATVDVWDHMPDGTWVQLDNNLTLGPMERKNYTANYTVTAADVSAGIAWNYINASGFDNQSIPDPIAWSTGTADNINEVPPELVVTFRGTDCLEVELDGSASTVAPGRVFASHRWYFGDATNSSNITGAPSTIIHPYSSCGPKIVTLEAWDNESAYNSTTEPIAVSCGPTARADATPSCFESTGTIIEFSGSASTAAVGQTIVSYNWTFSDNETGSSDTAAVTSRKVNDTVTATLTVTDSLGCEDTAQVTVGPCSEEVPAIGVWGVPMLTIFLVIVGAYYVRRDKARNR